MTLMRVSVKRFWTSGRSPLFKDSKREETCVTDRAGFSVPDEQLDKLVVNLLLR